MFAVWLLRELAVTRELLLSTHMRFIPSATWRSTVTLSAAPGVIGTSDRQLIPMQKKQPHVIGQPPDRMRLWQGRYGSVRGRG